MARPKAGGKGRYLAHRQSRVDDEPCAYGGRLWPQKVGGGLGAIASLDDWFVEARFEQAFSVLISHQWQYSPQFFSQ
jgi:hypothetical protein